MMELGRVQKLKVVRLTRIGAFLNTPEGREQEEVLLPKNQVPEGIEAGEEVEVFVYRDSEDRTIATTKRPKITLGEFAPLRVVENTKIGAFLDWGLEKDLLLPFKEQTCEVKKERSYLVGLYIDKSRRLCATMDVYKLLSDVSPYKGNERVQGTIYQIKDDLGAFVAVENKYSGMIPRKEFYGDYKCGDVVEVRIKKVREDGKLELSLRKEAYNQMKDDAEIIYERMVANKGRLPLNDDSSPDEIKRLLGMSKSAFKRAVGKLLKERSIRMTGDGIEIV
ncbi:MAG TPA: S1-like domain-containing RNA-binding protein [Clostridia bacterium]|nr:S1-like domain-containing RNA-binding protein [Clostridia bacterium]